MKVCFTDEGFEDYNYWISEDKKILKKINLLIRDIQRNGTKGIGKSEILKYDFAKCYSKRINQVHRLVFHINGNDLIILSCRTHYKKQ